MNEHPRSVHMSGEEIERTFGATDVLKLELDCERIQVQLDEMRDALSEHWDDVELAASEQDTIDKLEDRLKTLRTELRQKRKKYGQTVSETTVLS